MNFEFSPFFHQIIIVNKKTKIKTKNRNSENVWKILNCCYEFKNFPLIFTISKNCQKLLKNASIKGWQKMARDGWKWPGMAENGRKLPGMPGNGQKRPGMAVNGGKWPWMTKNERKLPFLAGIDQIFFKRED